MTRDQFIANLALLTDAALASPETDVVKASIVLSALLGCFAPSAADEEEWLDYLAITAGTICKQRNERRSGKPFAWD